MYSMTGRIRYSEVNSEKTLTLQALMDYLQDCCSFQSEDLGIGVDYLAREHRTWMLGAWQIRLCRMPRMGETIRVNTWPYDFNGFYGYRGFSAEGEDGEVLVLANSLWIFMDTGTASGSGRRAASGSGKSRCPRRESAGSRLPWQKSSSIRTVT